MLPAAADLGSTARRLLRQAGLVGDLLVLKALTAAFILAVGYLAHRVLRRVARRIVARADGDQSSSGPARRQEAVRVSQVLTYSGNSAIAVAVLVGLLSLVVDVGALVTSTGLLVLAVTVGAQTIVRDFFTGFFILLEQQLAVGDRVRIAGIEGVVHKISLRTVVLRDDQGALHHLATGSITAVSNLSQRAVGTPPK